MSERLDAILRELRAIYEEHYGPRLVRLVLFGSQARGDAEPDSDVDVLVVLHECAPSSSTEREFTGTQLWQLCLKYDVVVSPYYVSEERYSRAESPLLQNAREEGVLV